ncbi:hypothetical protein MTF65_26640 [Streptomyces sp. APSN-46.1]|uniref:hypothetical protein n=1 Tax=Streptomyces sp. APSN-46.1 TaxID=2929049 RepID=UPI001FB329CE|nr:hypothetical protein [Streptomyces sp. APSN-46.1]MCJ1680860.1 hypothetical protein [Streptomyces sp. APSN-46.1]
MYRRSAAAAVLLAAALTLTACGSDADKADSASAAKPKPPAASPVPDPADSPAAATTGTPSPGAKPTGPVLPDAKLTPKTGSFTPNEKQYLSGRVPEKTDPAAVLQSGQESCQRVARTAKRDQDAATGAVIAGEIPGAKDAITHLCPEQKPILAASEKGFPDGTRQSPAAGTYRALTQSTTCTWEAKSKDGTVLTSGPETPVNPGDKITATIPSGTSQFTSTGCYAWVPVS